MCFIIITRKTLGTDFQLLGKWFIDDKEYDGVLKIDPENHKSTKLTLSVDDNFSLTKIKEIRGRVTNINYYLTDCVYDINLSFANLKTFKCDFLFIEKGSEEFGVTDNFDFKCHSLAVCGIDHSLICNFINFNSDVTPISLFRSDTDDLLIKFHPVKDVYGITSGGYLAIESKFEKDFKELISILNYFSCFIFLFHNQFLTYTNTSLIKQLNPEIADIDGRPEDLIPDFGIDYSGLISYSLLGLSENRSNTKRPYFMFKLLCPEFTKTSSKYFNNLMALLTSSNPKDQLFIDSFNFFIDTCSGYPPDDLRIYQSQMSVLEGLYKYLYSSVSGVDLETAEQTYLSTKLNRLYSLSELKRTKYNVIYNLKIKDLFRNYIDKDLNNLGITLNYIVYLRNYVTHLSKDAQFKDINEKLALTKLIKFNHAIILFYILYFIDVSPKDIDCIILEHFKYLYKL